MSAPPQHSAGQQMVRGLRAGLVLIVLVVLIGYDLPFLLRNLSGYRPAWLAVTGYAGLLGIGVICAGMVLRRRAWGAWRWPLLAGAIAAGELATAAVPSASLLGPAHWSWELVPWFCAALLADDRLSRLVLALAAHAVLLVGHLAVAGRFDRPTLVGLCVAGMINFAGALALGSAGTHVRRVAQTAAQRAADQAAISTTDRIGEELQDDRRARYREIAATAAPLLEGLRDGTLSPQDPDVQRRCAVEAARLRRQMAERDDVPDALVHELRACIDVAQRAGVQVKLSLRGTRPALELQVRRALTESVSAMLACARQTARVTVVGTVTGSVAGSSDSSGAAVAGPSGEVVVSVVTDTDLEPAVQQGLLPGARAVDVDAELIHREGRSWLTVRGSAA